jgi:hypothetical protein
VGFALLKIITSRPIAGQNGVKPASTSSLLQFCFVIGWGYFRADRPNSGVIVRIGFSSFLGGFDFVQLKCSVVVR